MYQHPSPPNFSWVMPRRLAASAQPESVEHIAFLSESGVTSIVPLTETPLPQQMLGPDAPKAYHYAVRDYGVPSPAQASEIVTLIKSLLERGEAVLVHCGAGMGRTGTILACYLVTKGLSAADAVAEVRHCRPGSIETEAQENFVHTYASHLNSR